MSILQLRMFSQRPVLGGTSIGAIGLMLLAISAPSKSRETPYFSLENPSAKDGEVLQELADLNSASRRMYAQARKLELSTIPVVILVNGDDLILRKGENRTAVTVIPSKYHNLKSISHTTLSLFAHLAFEPGKPIDDGRLKTLKEYEGLLITARPVVDKCGFDPDTVVRQKRIIEQALEFMARVLRDRKVSAEDLTKFCRTSRPDIMANCAEAARQQLQATHKQVMAWKKEMTAEEWSALTIIVSGNQPPRVENAAVQYFSRLLGENGEGRRIVYAESLWDEEKAINLLGTLRLDGKLSIAVFNDPFRMYRDILADSARAAIDEIFATP